MKLQFRVPYQEGRARRAVRDCVKQAWVEGTSEQVEKLFREAKVVINGMVSTRADKLVKSEMEVVCELEEAGEEVFGLPDAEVLLWGEEWVVVEKPVGIPGRMTADDPMDPIRFMADLLGLDRSVVRPLWTTPAGVGGPWILVQSEESGERLEAGLVSGALGSIWHAQMLRPERMQWRVEAEWVVIDCAVTRTAGPLAEVQLTPIWKKGVKVEQLVEVLLSALAEAGQAVLGDVERGGYLVEGGCRLRLGVLYGMEPFEHSWPAPRDWFPDEVVVEEPAEEGEWEEGAGEEEAARLREGSGDFSVPRGEVREPEAFQVSAVSLKILEKGGHPWVLRDRDTGSVKGKKLGYPVRLVAGSKKSNLYALLDDTEKVAARLWSRDREEAREFFDEVAIRLDEAIYKRRALFKGLDRTDVFRIVHGEADGLPGIWVDRLGPIYRVTSLGKCAGGYRDFLIGALLENVGEAMVIHVDHTRDLRRREELPKAEVVHSGGFYLKEEQDLTVREAGLRYRVEPWEGVDVGFFADQRDNRAVAKGIAARQVEEKKRPRWLNLFCHTGAFSVALASVGATTVNVDLSRRYLGWLEENLALNGLDGSEHQSIAEDARYYVERHDGRFDGIIVDPPTASSGDRGFWSIREDYRELLTGCFRLLTEGGAMLVCRNEKRPKEGLKALIQEAADRAGRKVGTIEAAGPGADYPTLKGFPEGDKFEGYWVYL